MIDAPTLFGDRDGETELAPAGGGPREVRLGTYRLTLQPTPDLPDLAAAYSRHRPRRAADPIGLQGLPSRRGAINDLVVELCARLAAAAGQELLGRRLAEGLGLAGTRPLRLLVAYARVHHRLREIVGVPGRGYLWGPADPGARERMVDHARAMGRDWFFISGLYGHEPPAVQAAQLMLDFAAGPDDEAQGDELHAWLASEGVGVEQVLSAMIGVLADRKGGADILARVGRHHAAVLLPQATLTRLAAQAASLQTALAEAAAVCPGTGD